MSLPQPLVALPAFAFVSVFAGVVPLGLGFAGGAMVWMVVAQVLPAALEATTGRAVALAVGALTAVMLAVEVLLLA